VNGREFEAATPHDRSEPVVSDSEMERADSDVGRVVARFGEPPAVDLGQAVVAAIRPSRRRRRLLGMVPAAVSLGVTCLGAGMLGGVPGGGVVLHLPRWSSAALVQLVTALEGWRIALSTTAGLELGTGVHAAAIAAAVFGATATGALLHRWRRVAAWHHAR
jgi:hypothetical protein